MGTTCRVLVSSVCPVVAMVGVARADQGQKEQPVSESPDRVGLLVQRIQELEEQLGERLDVVEERVGRVDQRGFQYVRWQAQLFAVLMAVVLFAAGVAYGVGRHFGYKRLQAGIASMVSAQLDRCETSLKAFERRTRGTAAIAYKNAMAFCQLCLACEDAADRLDLPAQTRAYLMNVGIEGARVMVRSGESPDVIAGANTLSRRGTLGEDGRVLREGLERSGLSEEAYETMQRALEDLNERSGAGAERTVRGKIDKGGTKERKRRRGGPPKTGS